MARSFDLRDVDRITVGTVGAPGQRTFYLQARKDGTLVTVKLEKSQVGALVQELGKLIQGLSRPGHLPDDLELEEPVLAEWTVGRIGLGFDDGADRIVIELEDVAAFAEDEDDLFGPSGSRGPADRTDDEEGGGLARFSATREQVAALAIRGASLVEGGRPPCPLCAYPLDPRGHTCPKTNGNRPPAA